MSSTSVLSNTANPLAAAAQAASKEWTSKSSGTKRKMRKDPVEQAQLGKAKKASKSPADWDELEIYQQYLKEVSKHSLLSIEEERALISLINKGNRKALDRLVLGNLRFVINIAFMYKGQGLTINELINEGNIGLMEAARRFDASKEIKFISYAVWWVRQGITRAIAEKGRLIRISAEKELSLRQLNRQSARFKQTVGGEYIVDTTSLEGATKYSGEQIADVLNMGHRHASLDTPMGDEEGRSLMEIITSDGETPEEEVEGASFKKHLRRSISNLKAQEQKVLSMYYGIDHPGDLNLQEIGKIIGLSKERVRQVKEQGLASLRREGIERPAA